jgi:TRAP-type C4-dicarboxylate transport system substrate-binding protein
MLGASLDEVQKYVTLDGHLLGMAFLTVSEAWYQGLSDEDKEACLKAGREASIAARGTVRFANPPPSPSWSRRVWKSTPPRRGA